MHSSVTRGTEMLTAEVKVPRDTSVAKTVTSLVGSLLENNARNNPGQEFDIRSISHSAIKNSDWTIEVSVTVVVAVDGLSLA